MLSAMSVLARSAFTIISEENEIPFANDIVILWPCIEVRLRVDFIFVFPECYFY